MVDIEIEPFKKVVIRNYMAYDGPLEMVSTLSRARSSSSTAIHLLWANGILFRVAIGPTTDSIAKEYLQGIFHVDSIEFTEMKEYQNTIELEGEKPPEVKIANLSKHSLLSEIALFVKKKFYS